MNIYVFILLCFLPLILCFFVCNVSVVGFKFKYGLWASFLGLVSVIPIALVQFFILNLPIFTANTLVAVLVTAMIFNGLVEESLKMISMLFLPSKKVDFPVFFSMALLTGLALGCFETVIYLFAGQQEIGLRMITAVLIHTFCAGLSGCYVWLFRKRQAKNTPFIFAALLHGFYNFFAGFSGGYKMFAVLAIVMAGLECRIWYMKVKQEIVKES